VLGAKARHGALGYSPIGNSKQVYTMNTNGQVAELKVPVPLRLNRTLTAYQVTTPLGILAIQQCGPFDAVALAHFSDAVLHADYFFKRGHWQGLLSDSSVQVFAITYSPGPECGAHQLIGLCVTHENSVLHNLYLDPYWRQQGVGGTVLEVLSPEIIRCKTDSKAGDPTDFYLSLGYQVIQEKQGKNANIRVLQKRR